METATAAAAMVAGGSLAPALAGQVLFSQTPYGVWIQAYFTGFPDAGTSRFHGFHIHEHGAKPHTMGKGIQRRQQLDQSFLQHKQESPLY